MNQEITNMEILEALNAFSSKMDKRIDELNQKIDDFRADFDYRLDNHEKRLNKIELGFNNLINLFNSLVGVLKDKEIISSRESAGFLYKKLVN